MKQILKGVWIFSFALYTAYFFRHYSELPEKFITHWDASGQPNGWSLKEDFRTHFFALSLFVNALFLGMTYFIRVIPESMINWPDKAWWFATAARKQEAFVRIQSIFSLAGAYVNLVFLFCVHIIFQNAQVPVLFEIPIHLAVMIFFIATVALILFCMAMTFQKSKIT
jgi:uncharacterized membrane protein